MPQPIVVSIQENLAYFREKLDAGEVQYKHLAIEHENLKQAVRDGLRFEQTVQKSAELAIKSHPFITYFAYWPHWLPIYQEVAVRCHSWGYFDLECQILIKLGETQYQHDFAKQAVPTLRRAESLVQQLGQQGRSQLIQFHLAAAYLCQQNYRTAIEITENLLREIANSDNSSLKYSLLNLHGILSLEIGDFEQATQQFGTVTAYLESINAAPMEIAKMLTNWGQALREQREFILSEQKLKRGMALTSASDRTIYRVRLLLQLSYLYSAQENYRAATDAIAQISLPYLKNDSQLNLLAEVQYCAARIAWKMGERERAIQQVRQAIDSWQNLENRLMHAYALGLYGQILAQKTVATGRSKLAEAIEILASYPDNYNAVRLHTQLNAEYGKLS